MRHVIPISGKDSCTTAIVQRGMFPNLQYTYIFNDVMAELPETYEWLSKVESELNISITRIGKSLEETIYEQGMLPFHKSRFCTRLCKISPMESFIGNGEETCVYFGIRADEERVGYSSVSPNNQIIPKYPLKECGITLSQVYGILKEYDLLPPTFFWKTVYNLVLDELSYEQKEFLDLLPKWVFNSLFSWRSRTNCFWCFYQRRYEWAGLLEHHPDLFDKAERLEKDVGSGDRRDKDYYWIGENFPLSRIRNNYQVYVDKRVKKIIRIIDTLRENNKQAGDFVFDNIDLAVNKSCGIFCGK